MRVEGRDLDRAMVDDDGVALWCLDRGPHVAVVRGERRQVVGHDEQLRTVRRACRECIARLTTKHDVDTAVTRMARAFGVEAVRDNRRASIPGWHRPHPRAGQPRGRWRWRRRARWRARRLLASPP